MVAQKICVARGSGVISMSISDCLKNQGFQPMTIETALQRYETDCSLYAAVPDERPFDWYQQFYSKRKKGKNKGYNRS